jgi:AraC family transcriptional regulator, positive regulator of tynA and feaB
MSMNIPKSDRCSAATPSSNWQPVACANINDAQNYFRFNSHMCWDVDFERVNAVLPTVMDRKIGEICLRRISSGAVRAHRGSTEIRHDHGAYFCLSFITAGYEVLNDGAKQVTLESGDIATWHSSRAFTFASAKPVQKLSVYVPEASMQRIFVRPANYAGLYLKHNSGITALLTSYLAGLCGDFAMNDERTETEIEDVTLSLIGAAIAAPRTVVSAPPRKALWERVTTFIDRNLEDPELKPPQIASALGMSLRNLHLLFAEQGQTVAGWIRGRRLECCRAELAKPRGASTVMEVAFRWGFNDAAHFSRTFKACYGLSPRSFQQKMAS